MTRAPVRASLHLSWPKLKVRAPGAQAPPSRRCAFLRPTHEPELPIHLGIHRLLWRHSDESSNGISHSTKHNAEAAMFLRTGFLCLYFRNKEIDLEEKAEFFILCVDIGVWVI